MDEYSIHAIVFDEKNMNWTQDMGANYLFLKAVQAHMNNVLLVRGYLFLNDVYDALRAPRTSSGAIVGWHRASDKHDGYVDFGIPDLTQLGPIILDFNVDGTIYQLLPENNPISIKE